MRADAYAAAIMRALSIAAAVCWLVGFAGAQNRKLPAVQGDYTTAKAMKAVYGRYDDGTKSSVWTPKRSGVYEKSWLGRVRVRPLIDSAYTDGGVMRHMLITWARPDALAGDDRDEEFTCHACPVLVGVSVLRQGADGWRLESSELQLALTGAWGTPPQAKLQRLGAHIYGLTVQAGDTHQGEMEQAIWIYGPKAGRFKEWFHVLLDDPVPSTGAKNDWCRTKSTNPLDVMCVWDRIDYSMVEAGGEQMYLLQVTKRVGSGAKPRETRSLLRFRGTRYVAMK
jgi:hypothetical protein